MESEKWNLPIPQLSADTQQNSYAPYPAFRETIIRPQLYNGSTCNISEQFHTVPISYQCHEPLSTIHSQHSQSWILSGLQNVRELSSNFCPVGIQPTGAQMNLFSTGPSPQLIEQRPQMSIPDATNEVVINQTPVPGVIKVPKTRRKKTKSTIRKSQKILSPKKRTISSIQVVEETLKKPKMFNYRKPTSYIIEQDPVTASELSIVRVKCPHCPKDFETQHGCDLHKKLKHGNGSHLTDFCKLCSKYFSQVKNLIYHLWWVHYDPITVNYKCPFCDATHKYSESLSKHLKVNHPFETDMYIIGVSSKSRLQTATKFLCNSCPSVFDTFFKLNEHVSSWHGKLKYDCRVCGTLLPTLAHLEDHMQLLHPEHTNIGEVNNQPKEIDTRNLFKCPNCQSYFLTKKFLNIHQNAVHLRTKEEINYEYKCPGCRMSFSTEKRMIKHYISCNARTDLNCYWCTEVFSTEDAREKHFIKHHPGQELISRDILYRPYKCEICPYDSLSIVSLRIHFNLNHMEMLEKFNQIYPSGSLNVSTPRKEQINSVPFGRKETDGSSADKNMSNKSDLDDSGRLNHNDKLVSGATALSIKEKNPEKVHPSIINTCPVCEKSFNSEEFHEYHKSHERLSKKHCKVCNKLFYNPATMRNHQKQVHGQVIEPPSTFVVLSSSSEGNFFCRVCCSVFTATLFHQHHSTFELNVDKRICEFCNKMYFDDRDLRNHIQNKHSENSNDKLKRTSRKDVSVQITKQIVQQQPSISLAKPLSTSESVGLVVHTCKECLNNFKTPEFLSQHILEKHGGVINENSRPCCNICNKTFSSLNIFNRHKRTIHLMNGKKFPCQHCSMVLSRKDHYQAHVSKVHGSKSSEIKHRTQKSVDDKKFKCKFCRQAFVIEVTYKKHLKDVHFPQLCETFCDYCGIQISPERLSKHVSLEHPEQEHKVEDNVPGPSKNIPTKISLSELLKLVKEINEKTKSTAIQKNSSKKSRKRQRAKKRSKSLDSSAEEDGSFSNQSDRSSSDEDEYWISDMELNCYMNETSESDDDSPMSVKEIIPKDEQTTAESSESNMLTHSELDDVDQSPITKTKTKRLTNKKQKVRFSSPPRPEDSDEDFIPYVDESDEEFIPTTQIIPTKGRKSKTKSVSSIQRYSSSDYNSSDENSDIQNPTSRRNTKRRTGIESDTEVEVDTEKQNRLIGEIKIPVLVLHRCDFMLKRNFKST